MTYKETVEYMENAAKRGSIMGLERMERLCEILGNPQDDLRVIHVAGTNGKGSISAMVSSILTSSGKKCGMYYSPALTGITDHYRICSENITPEDYTECVAEIRCANEALKELTGEEATSFELETALAFVYFKKKKCDAVVLECGLGGRDDATNVVKKKELCIFSRISMDHMDILGDTIGKIAGVKSGIITCDCPVVCMDSGEEAISEIRKSCRKTGSTLRVVSDGDVSGACDFSGGEIVSYGEYESLHVGLSGAFQRINAAVAIEAAREIRDEFGITDENIREGLKNVSWPFRFEKIDEDPLTFVDGAHNEGAARMLCETVRERFSDRKIVFVVGMFKDKECEKVLSSVLPLGVKTYVITTPVKSRAMQAGELAKIAEKYCDDVSVCENIETARAKASETAKSLGEGSVVIAFGSLSYLSEYKDGKS